MALMTDLHGAEAAANPMMGIRDWASGMLSTPSVADLEAGLNNYMQGLTSDDKAIIAKELQEQRELQQQLAQMQKACSAVLFRLVDVQRNTQRLMREREQLLEQLRLLGEIGNMRAPSPNSPQLLPQEQRPTLLRMQCTPRVAPSVPMVPAVPERVMVEMPTNSEIPTTSQMPEQPLAWTRQFPTTSRVQEQPLAWTRREPELHAAPAATALPPLNNRQPSHGTRNRRRRRRNTNQNGGTPAAPQPAPAPEAAPITPMPTMREAVNSMVARLPCAAMAA